MEKLIIELNIDDDEDTDYDEYADGDDVYGFPCWSLCSLSLREAAWTDTCRNNDFVLFCAGLVFDFKEWKQDSKARNFSSLAVKKKGSIHVLAVDVHDRMFAPFYAG